MEENFNFTLEEFKKVINELEKEKIGYFVFGGFAYEAINNKKFEHGDLDLAILSKDKERLTNLFKKLGYKTYLHGNKHDYRKAKFKIDIIFIEDKGEFLECGGNMCIDCLSKEAFLNKNLVKIDSFEFNVMPYEWFYLYKDAKHYIPEKTDPHQKAMRNIIKKCKPIRISRQINIEKPKNMDLIEI